MACWLTNGVSVHTLPEKDNITPHSDKRRDVSSLQGTWWELPGTRGVCIPRVSLWLGFQRLSLNFKEGGLLFVC